MSKKPRIPMQLSDEFHKVMMNIQKEVMKSKGEKIALDDISTNIIHFPEFEEIQRKIIQGQNINLNLNIRIDKRR